MPQHTWHCKLVLRAAGDTALWLPAGAVPDPAEDGPAAPGRDAREERLVRKKAAKRLKRKAKALRKERRVVVKGHVGTTKRQRSRRSAAGALQRLPLWHHQAHAPQRSLAANPFGEFTHLHTLFHPHTDPHVFT